MYIKKNTNGLEKKVYRTTSIISFTGSLKTALTKRITTKEHTSGSLDLSSDLMRTAQWIFFVTVNQRIHKRKLKGKQQHTFVHAHPGVLLQHTQDLHRRER